MFGEYRKLNQDVVYRCISILKLLRNLSSFHYSSKGVLRGHQRSIKTPQRQSVHRRFLP